MRPDNLRYLTGALSAPQWPRPARRRHHQRLAELRSRCPVGLSLGVAGVALSSLSRPSSSCSSRPGSSASGRRDFGCGRLAIPVHRGDGFTARRWYAELRLGRTLPSGLIPGVDPHRIRSLRGDHLRRLRHGACSRSRIMVRQIAPHHDGPRLVGCVKVGPVDASASGRSGRTRRSANLHKPRQVVAALSERCAP